MIELFIEGYAIDISQELSTLVTYAVDDVKDFGAKNTAFSKTVVLPGTKVNNIRFGSIFDVSGANDFNPAQKNIGVNFNAALSARMVLFQGNIQAIKGVVQLLQVIVDNGKIEYEVGLFGELSGFVGKLGNKKLEDLDFSAYNQNFTLANIVSSWSNYAAGSGLYYPLIDYGNYSTAKHDWDVKTFRPSLFVKEYIDKIFTATGYVYDCALFNTARFKKFVVPHNQKYIQTIITRLLTSIRGIGFEYNVLSFGQFNEKLLQNSSRLYNVFTTSDNGTFTYIGNTATFTVDMQLNFNLNITWGFGRNIKFKIFINGTEQASETRTITTGTTYSWVNFVDPLEFTLNKNDTIEFRVVSNTLLVVGEYVEYSFGYFDLIGAQPQTVEILYNDAININNCIPKNILQKEFISSILKLSNMYVFEDTQTDKLLKIMPFVDFYANAPVLDWTDKIDRSKPIKIKPMSELNSRYYEFVYKDDSDYHNDIYKKRYNQSYGSLIYDSEYEFAKETTKVELIFAGTPLVGYNGEDKIYSTIFKKNGAVEEQTDSNIRILQANNISGYSSWSIKDGAGVIGSYTNFPYAGHFDNPTTPTNDINFGVLKEVFYTLNGGTLNVNQFNVYWSSYMAEITDKDSRLVTCTAKLSSKDIYNLTFQNLINIDGVVYRLNKIIDYNVTKEDVCVIELLKVINKIY